MGCGGCESKTVPVLNFRMVLLVKGVGCLCYDKGSRSNARWRPTAGRSTRGASREIEQRCLRIILSNYGHVLKGAHGNWHENQILIELGNSYVGGTD